MRERRQSKHVAESDRRAGLPAESLANPASRIGSRIETEILRLRGLMEKGQFAAALTAAAALLEEVPENRDVWYIIAVSQRYLLRIPDALSTLARFEQFHPDYSRLFQERGHCYVALRDADRAIEGF